MAGLFRQAARRIGGAVLQRTQAAPAVAEDRRRLVPRRMLYTEKGAGEDKWKDRLESFRRFDSGFTKVLNSVAVLYCIYAILACGDDPPWPIRKYRPDWAEEGAQTDKKQEE